MTWQERMRAKGIPVTDAESGGRPPVGAFRATGGDDAPRRLWVDTYGLEPGRPQWGYWLEPEEYVRADIADGLLAALQSIVRSVEPADFPEYHAARAAIAKATGGTE